MTGVLSGERDGDGRGGSEGAGEDCHPRDSLKVSSPSEMDGKAEGKGVKEERKQKNEGKRREK